MKSRVETEINDRPDSGRRTLPGSVEETKTMLWTEAAKQKTRVPVAFSQSFLNLIPRVYRLDCCLGTDFERLIRSSRRELHFCQNKTNMCGFLHGISEPLWKLLSSSLDNSKRPASSARSHTRHNLYHSIRASHLSQDNCTWNLFAAACLEFKFGTIPSSRYGKTSKGWNTSR